MNEYTLEIERTARTVRQLQQAMVWQKLAAQGHSRSVYLRFSWGEVRALEVTFSEEHDTILRVVIAHSEAGTGAIIAPTNTVLAIRTHETRS